MNFFSIVILTFMLLFISIYLYTLITYQSPQECDKTCVSCEGKNACGESCDFCPSIGKTCINGNCESKICGSFFCSKDCPCKIGTCVNSVCCVSKPCNGTCGTDTCGQKCECNDRYCPNTGCCQNGICNYSDVCSGPLGIFLKNTFGKFCDKCTNCKFNNAIFENDAFAPISGEIECICDNKTVKTEIDKTLGGYIYENGNLVGYANTCDTSPKDCSCVLDSDCIRFGAKKCENGECL